MSHSPQQPWPTYASTRGRVLMCRLLALVMLVQALWIPFHLASERHLAPGHLGLPELSGREMAAESLPPLGCGEALQPIGGTATLASTGWHSATGRDPNGPHDPHSVLDHKVAQVQRTAAHPLPWASPLIAPAPTAWALQPAVIARRAADTADPARPDDPGRSPSRPRAPPLG